MSFIISIEGNIGSGKSTLIKRLKEYINDNEDINDIVFVQEPVDEWNNIKDADGETIIQKFYANQKDYAFSFQIMAYITRLRKLIESIDSNKESIILCERSLETDKYVFAKMLYDNKKIREIDWVIYNYWFNTFLDKIKTNLIIYVRTSPDNCYERIVKRNRTGECNIPLEYLENCDKYHENWLSDTDINIKVINGNTDINNEKEYNLLLKEVCRIVETNIWYRFVK